MIIRINIKGFLLILAFGLFLVFTSVGCKQKEPICVTEYQNGYKTGYSEGVKIDSIRIILYKDSLKQLKQSLDSQLTKVKVLTDSVQLLKLELDSVSNTIKYEDYIAKKKLARIDYYIKICDKRATNKKYFFGWVKRAVRQ